jgi:hypothetical protein
LPLSRAACNSAPEATAISLIDWGRWLTAEGDSGIANDVDAHGWVLLLEPA